MIVLLAASSITLAALQASINAPRDAFADCLKQASAKAASEKVDGEAYEAYARDTCSETLSAFRSAVTSFDMKNKMSKKAATEDADLMIADFMGSAVERYKYEASARPPAAKQASAPATAAPAPTTPEPTPAAVVEPPK
jgi:hypothetical protein